jgi:hypothetical protein
VATHILRKSLARSSHLTDLTAHPLTARLKPARMYFETVESGGQQHWASGDGTDTLHRDPLSDEGRSELMRRVRSSNTALELCVRAPAASRLVAPRSRSRTPRCCPSPVPPAPQTFGADAGPRDPGHAASVKRLSFPDSTCSWRAVRYTPCCCATATAAAHRGAGIRAPNSPSGGFARIGGVQLVGPWGGRQRQLGSHRHHPRARTTSAMATPGMTLPNLLRLRQARLPKAYRLHSACSVAAGSSRPVRLHRLRASDSPQTLRTPSRDGRPVLRRLPLRLPSLRPFPSLSTPAPTEALAPPLATDPAWVGPAGL